MTARRGVAAALAVLLTAMAGIVPAMAQGFPPRVFRDARLKSEFHIQFAVDSVRIVDKTPGICAVAGRIERVFRGNVAVGTPITLDIDCKKEGDKVRPGQIIWTDADQLMAAKHIEAFVNRGPFGFQHSLWQFAIIPEPTEKPTIQP